MKARAAIHLAFGRHNHMEGGKDEQTNKLAVDDVNRMRDGRANLARALQSKLARALQPV